MPPRYAVGDLVEYDFRRVSGAQRKYGIVLAVKRSNDFAGQTFVTVQWSDNHKETYDSQHLIKVA